MSCLDKQRGSLFVFNDQWIISRPTTIQQWRATARPNPISNNGDEYVADTVYEIFDRKVDLRMGRIYTVIVQ